MEKMSTPNYPLDPFFEKLDFVNDGGGDGETTTTEELAFKESDFQNLIFKTGCTFRNFVDHVTGALWIMKAGSSNQNQKSCCLVLKGGEEPSSLPSNFDYSIDCIVKTSEKAEASTTTTSNDNDSSTTQTSTKLQLIAKDSDSVSATIQGLLLLCTYSSSDDNKINFDYDITIKAFARNPRQTLPTFHKESFLKYNKNTQENNIDENQHRKIISSLKFHFVTLDEITCHTLLSCPNLIGHIEFRQCTLVENLFVAATGSSCTDGNDECIPSGPKRLTISCTMPEFGKIAPGLGDDKTKIEELELQLHFWLQGPIFDSFINAIKTNTSLRKLSMEYLDINDDGWIKLCQSLQGHPKLRKLELGFTEKFVDTFRKLTPERRLARTKAILELLQVNTNIIELDWPEFQQDTDVMIQVKECLDKNIKNKMEE